jgi:hypothetical protein
MHQAERDDVALLVRRSTDSCNAGRQAKDTLGHQVLQREKVVGRAEVRRPFPIPGVGTIAGSQVTEGKITRASRVRLVRDSVPVFEGKVGDFTPQPINSAVRDKSGTIYLPVGDLVVDATNPVADQSAYTAIIAQHIELNKGPNLVLNADYDLTNVPAPEGLKGTTQVVLIQ